MLNPLLLIWFLIFEQFHVMTMLGFSLQRYFEKKQDYGRPKVKVIASIVIHTDRNSGHLLAPTVCKTPGKL